MKGGCEPASGKRAGAKWCESVLREKVEQTHARREDGGEWREVRTAMEQRKRPFRAPTPTRLRKYERTALIFSRRDSRFFFGELLTIAFLF